MAHTFMRSPEIVEQSLMADCGTTLDYTDEGKPLLDAFHLPASQCEEIREIQTGLLSFAAIWARHKKANQIRHTTSLKEFYRSICIRSVARPLEIELDLFGSWKHDENFGSDSTRWLATPVGLDEWEATHISAHQIASLPSSRVYWPFGFAHKIDRLMGEAVANIFLRTVTPEVFNSPVGAKYVAFYWDSGNGFNTDDSTIEEYSLSNRGKTWKRFTLELDHGRNKQCGLTIGLVGEILQLTGITLHYESNRGERRTLKYPHEMIAKQGYERVCGNLYLVKEDPAVLIVPTPDLERFTGRLHVDVFFSIICGV
jgi:hypothetical protein